MHATPKFLSAFVLATALAAVAAPSQALIFAQFSPDTGTSNYRFVNDGPNNTGTGAAFYTIASGNASTPGASRVHFSFLDPALSALAFLPTNFTLLAAVPSGSPGAIFTPGAGTWTQIDLNGGFSFIYSGPSQFYGSTFVATGANLLSGTFTDAWISGNGGSGTTNLSVGNGGALHFTSDFETFGGLTPGGEEFAFNLLGATPGISANPGDALKSFRANGGGNFSFGTTTVPEPATWGLMILGFGGVGSLLRRRRALTAFA